MDDGTGNSLEANRDYLSYLMRLSRTQSADTEVWRVSLEETLTERVYRFDSLHSLFAFLLARIGQSQSNGEGVNGEPLSGHAVDSRFGATDT